MLWQKRKLRPTELLHGRAPFIRQIRIAGKGYGFKRTCIMQAHGEKAVVQDGVRLHELDCHMLLEIQLTAESGSLVHHL
uniref:Uncharacterized protein n=1 Tax=Trichuris muris TaxID=70415 RepID=A0A5S6Q6N9_TRIMR